jgi:hypothetical protein
MRFDLILKNGRGVNASKAKHSPDEIAGYGFYCGRCRRGWTGDQLMQMTKENKKSQ